MEKKDGIRNASLSGKGLIRINRNLLIFAFFLLLSFIFWYLNSLSKEIDTSIKYSVSYTEIPTGRILSGNLPLKLNLMLKGHGYSILKLMITSNGHPLKIDFSEVSYNHDQKGGPSDYYIITAPLINSFNAQLMSECKIMSVKPDTLFFSMK
ncbi:MAG: hypothetical protein NT092_08735 [Bacteroidia bacterium]|nr:hypothetical protein [Bacteroidia bacterium]